MQRNDMMRAALRFDEPYLHAIVENVEALLHQNKVLHRYSNTDDVGIIVYGLARPFISEEKIIKSCRKIKRVSPMLYAVANAGSPISVVCTLFKLHGPTLNLSITLERGHAIARCVAQQWLENNKASCVLLIAVLAKTKKTFCVKTKIFTRLSMQDEARDSLCY